MKKFLCLLLASSLLTANAQDKDYKKQPTLIVNFTAFDFKTTQAINNTTLSKVFADKKWSKLNNMNIGFGLSYLKGLTNNIDFAASLNSAFVKYPFKDRPAYSNESLLIATDASVNVKLLSDKYVVVPYLSAGVGISKFSSVWGAYMPVGMGLQVKILDETYFMTNMQYRIPVTQEASSYLTYSIGFGSALSPGKKIVEEKPLPIIPVVETKVPEVEVVTVPKDSDGDGVVDDKDKCPLVAGVAKYMGCPVPDTDKDGINDDEDKCPNQPGVARLGGCPIADTDGDGVNDEMDKCPTQAGPASNNGCPVAVKEEPREEVVAAIKKEVNTAAKNIFFETGKATLLKKSYAPLKEVVSVLKANEDVKLDIEGYTDNTGSPAKNIALSQSRANTVLAYLVKSGISKERLTAKGYGQAKPIATNKTAAGRALNRRVVMNVVQ